MKALIKNGLVIDPVNNIKEKCDILIENNIVKEIGKKINDDTNNVIDAKDYIVSPGFVDLHANFCDPGVTSREDLKTGSLAAAKGGYTHIVLGPENKPSPSECNVIEYIKKYSNIMPINLYPTASVTIDRMGEEISDITFLCNHGAIAFYDGLKPILDKQLLSKIMKKCKDLNIILSLYSEDCNANNNRGILEGNVATKLNIKNPTKYDAEEIDLEENLNLAKFYNLKLDLAYVSAPNSFDIIERAKKSGQEIFCEIQALNILLNEKAMENGNTNAKLIPPLRPESDRKALIKALKRGIVDCISSNHVPQELEDKTGKFKDAVSGSIGLETTLGICGLKLVSEGVLNWKNVIEMISTNPAKLFGLDKDGAGSITIGKKANITIFNPNEKWVFDESKIISKSHNSPIIGYELKGKVKYTISNGRLIYKDVLLNTNE